MRPSPLLDKPPIRRALVIDDEPLARRRVRRLLESRGDLEVVGECESGMAAAELIAQQVIDLVVLHLPAVDGLQLVRRVGVDMMPAVIVTASEVLASSAYELAAADCLVKPFTDDRLMLAVDRALARCAERSAIRTLARFAEVLEHQSAVRREPSFRKHPVLADAPSRRFRRRFLVSIGSKDAVIDTGEVRWIRANGYYASLVTDDRKEHLVRLPLDQLEQELDPDAFVRVHRSAIVSLREVRGLERIAGRATVVLLRSGMRLPVSRSRRESLVRALGGG